MSKKDFKKETVERRLRSFKKEMAKTAYDWIVDALTKAQVRLEKQHQKQLAKKS